MNEEVKGVVLPEVVEKKEKIRFATHKQLQELQDQVKECQKEQKNLKHQQQQLFASRDNQSDSIVMLEQRMKERCAEIIKLTQDVLNVVKLVRNKFRHVDITLAILTMSFGIYLLVSLFLR